VAEFSLRAAGVVNAPAELVWRHLVDRESVSSWLDGVERLTGAGDRFATRRANEPCSVPIEGRVLELGSDSHVRLLLRAPWRLLREIEVDIALSPDPDGPGTDVVVHAVFRLRALAWLLQPLLRLRAEVALYRAVRGFRAAVEDEAARRRRPRPSIGRAAAPPPADQQLLLTLLD
jgi:uncharacterized protein YndB with AHSA1/START domain